jgi:hypothetical protein
MEVTDDVKEILNKALQRKVCPSESAFKSRPQTTSSGFNGIAEKQLIYCDKRCKGILMLLFVINCFSAMPF